MRVASVTRNSGAVLRSLPDEDPAVRNPLRSLTPPFWASEWMHAQRSTRVLIEEYQNSYQYRSGTSLPVEW